MKRLKKAGIFMGLLGVVFFGMISTSLAQGEDNSVHQIAVSSKIGTLGIGGELTYGFSDRLNARIGVNYLSFEGDDPNNSRNKAEFDMLTMPILLDGHPTGGGFRLSGGIVLGSGSIELTGDNVNETVKIGDNNYQLSSFYAKADVPPVVPYLGIGYGNPFGNSNWSFSVDLGAMAYFNRDVTIRAVAKDPNQQTALDHDLRKERDDIKDDLMFYPVVMLGVSYAF